MIKISKTIEYGLMSLKLIAESKDVVSVREISEELKIPYDPTSKALQLLAKNKILESVQGIKGGYKIIENLDNLSFLKYSEIIEQKNYLPNCSRNNGCKHQGDCIIETPIKWINTKFTKLMEKITISELLNGEM